MSGRTERGAQRRQAAARAALSALLEASGLSIRQFAPAILGVEERTVRRWLAGEEIPAVRAEWLISATIERLDDDAILIRLAS